MAAINPNSTAHRWLGRQIGNFHQLLSEVLARKQAEQRIRRILQAIRDVLLVHETAVSLPAAQRLEGLGNPRGIIKPGEALHARTPGHQIGIVRWTGLRHG
jgi:hypothetical protein